VSGGRLEDFETFARQKLKTVSSAF
jgi:hypothetical protein